MITTTTQRREAARRIIARAYAIAAIQRDFDADLIDSMGTLEEQEVICAGYCVQHLREVAGTAFALAGVVGEMDVAAELEQMEPYTQ